MEQTPLELLKWYSEVGADEAVGECADFFTASPIEQKAVVNSRPVMPISQAPSAIVQPSPNAEPLMDPKTAASQTKLLADNASTLKELEMAVRNFNGLAIKKTATNTVFSDGNPEAEIMLIGEAPGASEDMQGIPFCGKSGQLLDTMLASIGLNRTNSYISNVLFWRPPGNRRPTDEELEICRPFVERHIALIRPKLLIMVGGTSTSVLIDKSTGITKLRQRSHLYTNSYMDETVPAFALFHPSYLLRQPLHKKLAWEDLQKIKHHLNLALP
jgi:uracil-DNA glycosylase